ncbi:unnamed protein product, partial [marine sediment metagenome]
EYLTGQIPGHAFVIVPLGFDEVCPAVEQGEVDFVLANPSRYVEIEARYGANRLATLKNHHLNTGITRYGGVIFCRADRDDIKCLTDLKGKTFMAVSEKSLGGWLAAWRELKEVGIDPQRDFAELRFGGTHDAVACAVREGLADAGTVRTDTLERMQAEGKIDLGEFRVIHEHAPDMFGLSFRHSTRLYPEWPFVKVAHTSDELAQKVAVALLRMPADSPAAQAARCAGWTVPHNYQPVHECLKELRVGPYEDLGRTTFGALVRQYWRWLAAGVFLALAVITTLSLLRLNRRLNQSRLDLARELSERKRAEEALRESEQRYRHLFEGLGDAVFLADVDTGRILQTNRQAEILLGRPRHEIVGTHQSQLHPPDQADRYRQKFAAHVEKSHAADFDGEVIKKDGTTVPVTISASTLTLGGRSLILGLFRDDSERKGTEQALRESEERFRR